MNCLPCTPAVMITRVISWPFFSSKMAECGDSSATGTFSSGYCESEMNLCKYSSDGSDEVSSEPAV